MNNKSTVAIHERSIVIERTTQEQPNELHKSNRTNVMLNCFRHNNVTKWKMPNEELRVVRKYSKMADFSELTIGYNRTYREIDYAGMYVGKEVTEWIEMDKSRPCSYSKQKYDPSTRKYITDAIELKGPKAIRDNSTSRTKTERRTGSTPPEIEYRGITLRQLRAIEANIKRRCIKEKWLNYEGKLLTPKEVTLYDTDKYVIKPFTMKQRQSFVTSLPSTAGNQPPRWVASHWWGQPIMELIQCIEQFIRDFGINFYDDEDSRGGGMSADTPIWIWAYANNHWERSNNVKDPKDLGICKASEIAEGRTLTILDKKGTLFHRIWCIYEFSLTLIDQQQKTKNEQDKKRLWAVYTAHKHTYKEPDFGREEDRDAVGIISGGSTSDAGYSPSITARQRSFPVELITKSLSTKVEDAEATHDPDRVLILNSILGNLEHRFNQEPPKFHEQYTALNNVLRGNLALAEELLINYKQCT